MTEVRQVSHPGCFLPPTQQGADRLQVDVPELAQGLQQHPPQLLVA